MKHSSKFKVRRGRTQTFCSHEFFKKLTFGEDRRLERIVSDLLLFFDNLGSLSAKYFWSFWRFVGGKKVDRILVSILEGQAVASAGNADPSKTL